MGIDTDQVPINEAFTAALEALGARIEALEAGGAPIGTDFPVKVEHTLADGTVVPYTKT